MSTYYASIMQMKKMLTNLDKWLDTAVALSEKKSFDPNVLLTSRLAPDQYPLVRQIQSACDGPKFAAARLTGKEAPKNPDTETTMPEIRARIQSCLTYLDTYTAADFANVENRRIDLPFFEGKGLSASNYLNELVLPNFYFHLVHAYAIMRHNGVDLGKTGYIGAMTFEA